LMNVIAQQTWKLRAGRNVTNGFLHHLIKLVVCC
jgi:hypothetical protein